jgi:predicted RNase H-like nuclease (RuvC/YqgF family)
MAEERYQGQSVKGTEGDEERRGQGSQLEMSMERLSSLIGLFKEKVSTLDGSIKALDEKVAMYAEELARAYKNLPKFEAPANK